MQKPTRTSPLTLVRLGVDTPPSTEARGRGTERRKVSAAGAHKVLAIAAQEMALYYEHIQ